MTVQSYTRPQAPCDDWTAAEWLEYRDRQAAACERFGEPWASNVGRALVHMAEVRAAKASA